MLEIKKIGHCCLLIKINGVVILTDPGSFMAEDSAVSGVDVVVVTHEHRDHFHLQSLKEIIKLNPKVKIFTNGSVGKIMSDQSLVSHILNDGEEIRFDQVKIRAFDAPHEEIYRDRGLVENTAFLFDDRFLYPGDSFYRPDQSIDVLALPVAGPWCLIKNAIDYALDLRPRAVFPVHDGMIKDDLKSVVFGHPQAVLAESGIDFVSLGDGQTEIFD